MSTKTGRYSKKDIAFIEQQYLQGESVEDIADSINRDAKSVFNIILKNGFKQGKRVVSSQESPVQTKSKKVFAKPNAWADEGDLAIADKDIDAKIIRRPVERTRKSSRPRQVLATCRHCDEKKMADVTLVMENEFSCKECLRELAAR